MKSIYRVRGLALVVGLLVGWPAASAQAAGADEATLSVTVSPIHLLFPMLEASAEFQVSDNVGLAVIGAYGEVGISNSSGVHDSLGIWELGGQVRYYFLESFESLHAGVEALYIGISESDIGGAELSANASGVAVGPFVGWKGIFGPGFTFVVQLGAASTAVSATATDSSTGETATVTDRDVLVLLNLDLGWSF
jgi:hypothetical protein